MAGGQDFRLRVMGGSLQGAYLEFEACRGSSSAFEPPLAAYSCARRTQSAQGLDPVIPWMSCDPRPFWDSRERIANDFMDRCSYK